MFYFKQFLKPNTMYTVVTSKMIHMYQGKTRTQTTQHIGPTLNIFIVLNPSVNDYI